MTRIAVAAPYFGLGAMNELGPGVVSAVVPVTPPASPEQGPIEAAQVARHLAILGSCAAALARDDDKRHHYLATEAHYARLADGPATLCGGVLAAEAVASWIDRRNARALVKLSNCDGRGLHVLDVRYSVLAPKMFARFHPPIEAAALSAPAWPEDQITRLDDGLRIECGPISADDCAGHFPDYPAAPVAIVMGRLCRAAGLGLAAKLDQAVDYRIEEGHVTATRLARAGEHLTLEVRYGRPTPTGHLMHGTAEADGEVVGEVAVSMSTHAPAGA